MEAPALKQKEPVTRGNWKPILTLLLLSPGLGELLSGSSPPVIFFNPVFLLLLMGLYGCGALLIREAIRKFDLNITGLLLLGMAYAIIEEGLCCKSFFNPYWKDVGYLSTYGRALGVNWIWLIGLTVYHTCISITAPIFITEALFPQRAGTPWLRRRGWIFASLALFLVTSLGFAAFDSTEFHMLDVKDSRALARKFASPTDPVSTFIHSRLKAKNQKLLAAADSAKANDLRNALLDELNRLLPSSELFSEERFASVQLKEETRRTAAQKPKGDKLVKLNRALLEQAFPQELTPRPTYPYYPSWLHTVLSCGVIALLIFMALKQKTVSGSNLIPARRPWANGLWFTPGFVLLGFLFPGLAESGARIPPLVTALVWLPFAWATWRTLRRIELMKEAVFGRGLWGLGAITPWTLFAVLLGLVVQMQGAKSFEGMAIVAVVFASAVIGLSIIWRRRLQTPTAT
jgi:hypothetical protein